MCVLTVNNHFSSSRDLSQDKCRNGKISYGWQQVAREDLDAVTEVLKFNKLMILLNIEVSGVQGFTYFDKPNDMIANFFSNNNYWKDHLINVLE